MALEFKIVVNDPKAEPHPRGHKVHVKGVDEIPFSKEEEIDQGTRLPVAKANPKLLEALNAEYSIVTVRLLKKEGDEKKKITAHFVVEADENVPENEIWANTEFLSTRFGENEFDGEAFRTKAFQITLKGEQARQFVGKKYKDLVPASVLGIKTLKGKFLEIRGGSDESGFPMRPDIPGPVKKRVLLSGPPGFHPREHGERRRKTVRGNTITEDYVQINTKIVEG
ncbi:30S ribosomal protein S6 [Ignicoccus islandicus DSM 13165]|uniref:Small ribosomal subunit protein eS6 n=1 Tax=Ignicoccus islandicus DSM 13165 TaxID=940295 RepID=A0A0U3E9P2_9CREN|nr:30S ribosomal protein S6e [Ignicoccus islandicus]ALU12030.1 30S ribosomal protein S6 [Ignicoccus islandicus DSM 13165]